MWPIRGSKTSRDTDHSAPPLLLPSGDHSFLQTNQNLLQMRKSPSQLHPSTPLKTLLHAMTESNGDSLWWSWRLVTVDIHSRFYLTFLYDALEPPSQRRGILLDWLPSSTQEQPTLTDLSFLILVQCLERTTPWNALARINIEHADALKAVSNAGLASHDCDKAEKNVFFTHSQQSC